MQLRRERAGTRLSRQREGPLELIADLARGAGAIDRGARARELDARRYLADASKWVRRTVLTFMEQETLGNNAVFECIVSKDFCGPT